MPSRGSPILNLRLSDRQRQAWERAAAAHGYTALAPWIKAVVDDAAATGTAPGAGRAELYAMRRELSRMATTVEELRHHQGQDHELQAALEAIDDLRRWLTERLA